MDLGGYCHMCLYSSSLVTILPYCKDNNLCLSAEPNLDAIIRLKTWKVMEPATEQVDRDATTPFLVKLFYRTGAFHRPDEFTTHHEDLPPHITIHTWPTATLTELTHLLASHSPHILPSPSIGTRLAYRLLYHDTRAGAGVSVAASSSAVSPSAMSPTSTPRLATQDLGSVVIGNGGPGIAVPVADNDGDVSMNDDTTAVEDGGLDGQHDAAAAEAEARKTLADARFVPGDFLSVAILPPSAVDGSVQSAGAARMGRGYGIGQATAGSGGLPPSVDARGREWGYGYARGRMLDFRQSAGGSSGIGIGSGSGVYGRESVNTAPPLGEWRRGERLPDMPPPSQGRGRRRW
ncbi:Sin3 associated polypeptide p18-domain-containing protein [Coniella lustricola]|uniref:Sin3 associated polypeptide p18-domain-containing protein n=1 Tax=Coniella lustricola TaxID=2025994 RepID=A0A2T3AN44_9PEZI|nr:Sin3 associated polypeptide p18-domain-containing protein [Coniella lustricola]